MELSHDYFAPDAADFAYQEVVRFLHIERAARTTDEHFASNDLWRRKAESEMQVRWASPEVFASAICSQNASLSRSEKSRALASVRWYLGIFPVARQLRRLLGPRVGVVRRDGLPATSVDVKSKDEDDFAT